MIEMNPYYAHESEVGAVFDVATWSPRKSFTLSIFCILLGLVLVLAVVYVWDSTLLVDNPAEWMKAVDDPIATGHKDYPQQMKLGLGTVGIVGLVMILGGFFMFVGSRDTNYFFRAGPGGFSIRVLTGVDWSKLACGYSVLELDIGWNEIERWQVTQQKQFGALSRNDGNIGADFDLKTVQGKKYWFSLDMFREPGHIIYDRIQQSMEMVPANLG